MDANEYATKPKYISGKNITEYSNRSLVIIGIVSEAAKEGDVKKLMVCFDQTDIKLVLNQTNLKILIQAYGSSTDGWRFKEIKLISIPAKFNGQETQSVVVIPSV